MSSVIHRILQLAGIVVLVSGCASAGDVAPPQQTFQFVYTSDSHYGITRTAFRGGRNVAGSVVNAALVDRINALPRVKLPCDDGVNACATVGSIDFLVDTGDLANRMEDGVQPAERSWQQFSADYLQRLTIKDAAGHPARVFLTPGNHDVSNAIGFYKPMTLSQDARSMAGIYNLMLHPATPLTAQTYHYADDRVHYSQDVGGVHLVFLNIWPDSVERNWMETDLKNVGQDTPVVIFTHDPPEVDAKHFMNPNGTHDINATDKFENLLADMLADKDKKGEASIKADTLIEQRELARFLKAHRNIVAYFHGHNNYNEYYVWKGPDKDVALKVFRVDSPMKGEESAKNEAKLSFQVVSVDARAKRMTVREYLWNTGEWGTAETVSLAP